MASEISRGRCHLFDALLVRPAQEETARIIGVVTVLLASLADGRRIDERQKLGEVACEQRVEQRLVGILQGAQEEIAFEIGLEFAQALQPALDLFVEGADMRRQQAMQVKFATLILGEGRPLVEQGIGQKGDALKLDVHDGRSGGLLQIP